MSFEHVSLKIGFIMEYLATFLAVEPEIAFMNILYVSFKGGKKTFEHCATYFALYFVFWFGPFSIFIPNTSSEDFFLISHA